MRHDSPAVTIPILCLCLCAVRTVRPRPSFSPRLHISANALDPLPSESILHTSGQQLELAALGVLAHAHGQHSSLFRWRILCEDYRSRAHRRPFSHSTTRHSLLFAGPRDALRSQISYLIASPAPTPTPLRGRLGCVWRPRHGEQDTPRWSTSSAAMRGPGVAVRATRESLPRLATCDAPTPTNPRRGWGANSRSEGPVVPPNLADSARHGAM